MILSFILIRTICDVKLMIEKLVIQRHFIVILEVVVITAIIMVIQLVERLVINLHTNVCGDCNFSGHFESNSG